MKQLLIICLLLIGYSCEPQSLITTQRQASNQNNYTNTGNTPPDNYTQLNVSTTTYTTEPALSKPDYLETVIDPRFGVKITRITGDVGVSIPNVSGESWRNIARHGYSSRQPWNADETILYINKIKTDGGSWGSSLFLDGQSYEVIKKSNIPSNNEQRWHPTDPDIIQIIRDDEIVHWSYSNNTETQVYSLSGYSNVGTGNTGNFSDDGNVIALMATRNSDSKLVAFSINIDTDTKGSDIDLSGFSDIDFVTTSPLGTYIVVNGEFTSGQNDRTRIYNATTGAQVGSEFTGYGRPSHFDVAIDQNGDEVVVGSTKSSPNEGYVIKKRMSDGAETVLTTGGYGGHGSARAILRRGWVVTSGSSSTSYPPYYKETYAVKLDGSRVERIFQYRSSQASYDLEVHACISPSGGRIIFASDWNNGTFPVNSYVADFRDKY